MGKVRVNGFSVSLDGFGAGPAQGPETPLGKGGEALHEWLVDTPTFKQMVGETGGTPGVDEDFSARAMANVGAWILGRNMFGPVRGPWPDASWKGWWGDSPPYHVPVFVLTHHAREDLKMDGNTTFHFVTGGIEEALDRARAAAGDKDVRVGGGASTIRQYLEARLLDEVHVVFTPAVLGSGESLFAGIDLVKLGYRCTEFVPSKKAMHAVFSKT